MGLFAEQNEVLRDNIEDLNQLSDELRQQVLSLQLAIQVLLRCNRELKKTASKLKHEVSLFTEQNRQFRALARECKEGAEQFLSTGKNHNNTQAALLQTFAAQITSSDQLWEQIRVQMDSNSATHAAIVEQQREALAQLRDPELRDALRKDIQEATQEFRKVLEEIRDERIVLEALKKDHQAILAQYCDIATKMAKHTEQLGNHVSALGTKASDSNK